MKINRIGALCLQGISKLEVQVVISLILAIFIGIYSPDLVPYFSWMGDIFIKLLKLFLAPLLFFSLVVAIVGLGDFGKLGKLGLRTMSYYVLTTAMAIVTCLALMNLFAPGVGTSLVFEGAASGGVGEKLSFGVFLQGLISDNVMQSFLDINAMQIVVIAIGLGIALISLKDKRKVVLINDVFSTLNDAILSFIMFVVRLTPFGVLGIVSKVVAENGVESIGALIPFSSIILLALAIHGIITLPLFAYFLGKFHPYKFFSQVREAILLGFSTASSSATMGLSMQVAKEKAHISDDVVNFTVPLGTTVNMNGTALYQAGVAIFIAQVLGIDLSLVQQITVVVIVIMASIGAAGVPGAGILILTTVFLTIGLPVEAIGIILAVDRILDMFRTAMNVWGDLITAKVVDHFYSNHVEERGLLERLKRKTTKKEDIHPLKKPVFES